ncbi:MAG: glucose-6-phosphate dehydrogenase [Planctomycetia bacterium]|nr:glucose-6-phosphate dehydrogenase [Planctomycetia bacterium]
MMNVLIIFGASGDLTSRKIIPALFQLFSEKKLPKPFAVIGISRTRFTSAEWRKQLKASIQKTMKDPDFSRDWDQFESIIHYFSGDVKNPEMFFELNCFIKEIQKENGEKNAEIVYYLAVAPILYTQIIQNFEKTGLAAKDFPDKYGIILEKPFGMDRQSAEDLNRQLHSVFQENQIFRIDHYLGKETVNNIFALRFANTIFEPLWNRDYIEHIQITVNESLPVGRRGPFYESTGILRDMFQNHLLQLLSITAMEPPAQFDAKFVRDEKVKVLRSIRKSKYEIEKNMVYGQYVKYREEQGVHPDSLVPTFIALRLFIDNWRWKGVPFYLRSGKSMSCQTSQILIQYKKPPHWIFENEIQRKREKSSSDPEGNSLLIQIQPSEGIRLNFLSKVPGTIMLFQNSELTFSFGNYGKNKLPEAYQRLLLDVFSGDPSLFARNDEVEAAWDIIDPFQNYIDSAIRRNISIPLYESGSWGPSASDLWMQKQGRTWLNLCPIIDRPEKNGSY